MDRTITFISQDRKLAGTLHLPAGRRPPVVIGSHGLLGTRASAKQVALAEACSAAGMAFLRFDHRGCGESDPAGTDSDLLAGRVTDLLAAVSWVTQQPDLGERIGLFGSSLGGAVCLAAFPACRPAALVTWAAPVASSGVNLNRPEASLPPGLHYRSFNLSGQLSAISHICVCHGDRDQVVPVENAHVIAAGVGAPRNLIIFRGAGHRMSAPAHHQRFVAEAVRWFSRYL
ncbi:MAG: alpha/beta fold hydrolase [Pseudomonadota bacterium]